MWQHMLKTGGYETNWTELVQRDGPTVRRHIGLNWFSVTVQQ